MNDAIEVFHIAPETAWQLANGALPDPFGVLGPHQTGDGWILRAMLPGARAVEVVAREDGRHLGELLPGQPDGLFTGRVTSSAPYRLRITWPDAVQETEDPYAFTNLLLSEQDLHLFNEGRLFEMAFTLGAMPMTIDGVPGVRFAVWAPNAEAASVVGDFDTWDPRRHPMRLRYPSGVWELFVPRVKPDALYKFALIGPHGQRLPLKADPLARATQAPPATASVVADIESHIWRDGAWMASRASRHAVDAPISIYEVHAASWFRFDPGGTLNWDQLAERLIPYVVSMGFTHLEFMPISEHPFGGSWGYQPLGLFAPSGRFGPIDGFCRFVDACHQAGIGVIVDWVPAHFPTDIHGLAHFDGTPLYEHADPREG
ncbi:MAG TPA: alpha-amylase family glycosyl hydrolase, partial [Rhodopila sp.]|nr:alpha-amylase family glycosyl hydrolase [Rhodopila sp.]